MKKDLWKIISSGLLAACWLFIGISVFCDPDPSKYKIQYGIASVLLFLNNLLNALEALL